MPLRAALALALQAPGSTAGMPDDWPVLVDTLQALVGLSAESDVLLAALLFGVPGLQPLTKPQLAGQAGVVGLLEGQDAAAEIERYFKTRTEEVAA